MIKKWLLKSKWVQDYLIEKEKDFATRLFKHAREDVLEQIDTDIDERAKELMEERLMKLLSSVDYGQVVKIDKVNKFILIGDKRVEDGTLANLKSEAEFIMQSHIWKLLSETPKELAQQALFKVSESLDDLKKGKSILYTLDAQQNIINIFKGYVKK